jgi:energy-coupling factor transporter ATP-binding protein EcfA2
MRIKSVILRQYRIHREFKVDLDDSRTLIGGSNESGKSTLVEAVHRAFFLKAKGNTENHRAMVSTIHSGHPEVEIHFEAGGVTYHLKKRFGSSGTTTLASSNSASLSGDAAESELARILGVESGGGGKAATTQWSHLWIWQGCSGDDPLDHANAQQANLLRRLQDSGGAAAMQSELDSQVSQFFTSATDGIFTQAGKSKAGSELEKAETKAAAAEDGRQSAATRLENSLQLVRNFDDATQTLARVAGDVVTLTRHKVAVDTQLARADELRVQESAQSIVAQGLSEKHAALDRIHQKIVQLRATVEFDEAALAPKSDETLRLTEARDGAKRQSEFDARAYDSACDRTRTSRQRRDLAVAFQGGLEKVARFEDLSGKVQQAQILDTEISNLRPELARLAEIDATQLQDLQQLETELTGADATLHAMAAGLEVVTASDPVLVAGVPLAAGQTRILTEDTEVTVGQSLRLVVRPGGGTSLADARQNAQDARQAFRKALDALGVVSFVAASEVVTKRSDISTKIGLAEAALRALDSSNLAVAFADARDASAAAEAEVIRRSEAVSGFAAPALLADAKKAVSEEERLLREVEAGEAQAKDVREFAAAAFQKADDALTSHQQTIARQTREVAELRAQLRLLVETHGEDTARAQSLADALTSLTTANDLLASTRRALTELQPELLNSDFTRLQAALGRADTEKREAELKQGIAQAGLRSDGADDPDAALAVATAQARFTQEHLASVRRKAEAFRLLHSLFLNEQRALADRFTRPLADKISGYLECLFGAGTRANVVLAENAFSGLQLVRPTHGGGAVPFDSLSGGAREQVAAAVRLAMAEVLCNDHHGCLPVIFDDAFAYSDPERVQTLQRMLYLAASRGLQVIVLTCAPSDYAALGAAHITMRAEKNLPTPASSQASDSPIEEDPEATVPVTQEQRDQLYSRLNELGGKAGNYALRDALGWNEMTYNAVKDSLVSAGVLIPGKGRGGSVALASV